MFARAEGWVAACFILILIFAQMTYAPAYAAPTAAPTIADIARQRTIVNDAFQKLQDEQNIVSAIEKKMNPEVNGDQQAGELANRQVNNWTHYLLFKPSWKLEKS